jgi:hypothetical protein
MKPNYKRILFQVIFTIIGVEIVLRIFGVRDTYMEKVRLGYVSYYGQTEPTWYHTWPPDKPVKYNEPEIKCSFPGSSLGLREREIPLAKNDSVKRLFFVGDSFTEGAGVEYPYAMPRYFEKKLDSAAIKAEVFNAGVSGSDPFFEYILLRDKLMPLHPDMVILCINSSDIQDYILRGGMERFNPNGTTVFHKGPWWEPIYHYSRIFRLFVHYVLQYDSTLVKRSQLKSKTAEAELSIQKCLYQTQRLCQANNVKFICVLNPVPRELKKRTVARDIEDLVPMISPDSLQFINLYPDFRTVMNEANWLAYSLKINGHYNRVGYNLFSDLLFDEINKKYPDFLK